jgi:DNA-binding Lrp family transcriptional regulator
LYISTGPSQERGQKDKRLKTRLNEIDKRLFGYIQTDFPLSRQPFSVLGWRLGISGEEVIGRIEDFKKEGIVRQIGPVLEARRLGRRMTLVAMRVTQDRMEKAAETIRQHPGISHGYEREHDFNLWFTLSALSQTAITAELKKLGDTIEAEAVMELPVLKLFKIGFYLDMVGDGQQATGNRGTNEGKARLSPTDKAVINELQQDLPLVPRPFDMMSNKLGIDTTQFLERCRSLKERGVMRRFGAAVNHKRAGFKANAMTCWAVPGELVDVVGSKLAAYKEVSHCYERKTNRLWPYNVFAMIHGHTRQDCLKIADEVTRDCRLDSYVTLFSTRELKKVRVKYLL